MWDVWAHVLCKFHAGTPVCRSAAGEKRKKMIVFFRHRDHALGDFFGQNFFTIGCVPGVTQRLTMFQISMTPRAGAGGQKVLKFGLP